MPDTATGDTCGEVDNRLRRIDPKDQRGDEGEEPKRERPDEHPGKQHTLICHRRNKPAADASRHLHSIRTLLPLYPRTSSILRNVRSAALVPVCAIYITQSVTMGSVPARPSVS